MTTSSQDKSPLNAIDFNSLPDAKGHFGQFGGRFVSETPIHALDELSEMYERLKDEPSFRAEFDFDMAHYVGRPSPLYFAERWTKRVGGAHGGHALKQHGALQRRKVRRWAAPAPPAPIGLDDRNH